MSVPPSVHRSQAIRIWRAGVAAADPRTLLEPSLRVEGQTIVCGGRSFRLAEIDSIVVVGAGKAGGRMSLAVERILGPRILRSMRVRGWVNVPDAAVRELRAIQLHGARSGHSNRATRQGVAGARRIVSILEGAGPRDLCLCLLSGGGSALLPLPAPGLTLRAKQQVTGLLQAAGASIDEVNTVRKHLSAVKGGGLLRRWNGRWLSAFALSDVTGDRLDVIASGPTAPDPTTFADAIEVLRTYAAWKCAPDAVRRHLAEGAGGRRPETLKRLPDGVENIVIGGNHNALGGARREAARLGFRLIDPLSDLLGEASEAGRGLARLAREVRDQAAPGDQPVCIVAGGETTVRLGRPAGRGGRCQEMVLAGLAELGDDARGIVMLCAGTDGEDGPTDAAGAITDGACHRRAARLGLDPEAFLARHDSYRFFERTEGLLKTGLTGTNVMDMTVVLIGAVHRRASPGVQAGSQAI